MTSALIERRYRWPIRFFRTFWRPGLSREAGSALRALALAYQYVQQRAINQEKCPDLHFYVAHSLLQL
jgi:hypothetical protein